MKIKTITPGVRLPGDNANDQKRITSPKDALVKQKAYGIVIGRSISSGNIVNNFKSRKIGNPLIDLTNFLPFSE